MYLLFFFLIFCTLAGGLLKGLRSGCINLAVIFSTRSHFIMENLKMFSFPLKLSESEELKEENGLYLGLLEELKVLKVNVLF